VHDIPCARRRQLPLRPRRRALAGRRVRRPNTDPFRTRAISPRVGAERLAGDRDGGLRSAAARGGSRAFDRSGSAGNVLFVAVLASRYTPWQREAIAAAYTLTNATAGRVVDLAATGELDHPSGGWLPPFEIPVANVRSVARRARVREANAEAGGDLSPRDAVEQLRCRLLDGIDRELTRVEIEQGAGRLLDFRALSGITRALRELAWLPGPSGRHSTTRPVG
jgi:hypothetical protein